MNLQRPAFDDSESLPPDLASMARMLDLDADAAAPGGLEDRIVTASLASLKGLAAVEAGADRLASADRAAASVGMEARVSDASAEHLVGVGEPVRLHLAGPERSPGTIRRRVWTTRWSLRAIAAGLLIGTAGILILGLPPSAQVGTSDTRLASLKASVDEEFDTLLTALSDTRGESSGQDSGATPSVDDLLNDEGTSG